MRGASAIIYITIGRALLALYFFVPGIAKLLAPTSQVEMMQHHNIPYALPLLYIAGAAQVSGAVLLATNRYVRLTALGFVLYILVINVTMHDFWNFAGVEAVHELQNHIKNLGILAGLLVLAGVSPKRKISVKAVLRPDSGS
ncbi:MAG: DoxX family protein [Robiginitomaculum sp.]|nr:DoxX family protein [Robiginitomaculum sp.]